MYYLSTVIEKLVTPDKEVRRADRHHARQRSAKVRQTHGEAGAGSSQPTD